jgi:hypothetical protein
LELNNKARKRDSDMHGAGAVVAVARAAVAVARAAVAVAS